MITFKERLQNIYSKLSFLMSQFNKICAGKLSLIPMRLEKVVVGTNKLPCYIGDLPYGLEATDLAHLGGIKNYAFYERTNLNGITLPNNITFIGDYAFEGCTMLPGATINGSVTSIGTYAFSGCTGIHRAIIGKNVTSIGYGAFSYCTNLANIYVYSTVPPALGRYAIPSGATIRVPVGSGNTYKNATNWSNYSERIVEDADIVIS